MPPQHSPLRRSPRLSLPPHHHPHHRHRSNQSLALALHHEPTMAEEAEPKPLKVYHPTKSPSPNKALLLSSASFSSSTGKKTMRRSPRLMAASIGVVTSGKCGSAMLLKLPDSSEKKACQLTRACLADTDFNVKCLRSWRLPAIASSPLPSCGKRKLDSRKICEDSEEMPVNRGSLRSSRRFSEPEFVDSLACKGSTGKSRRKSARESEKAPLALPSSCMVEDLGKSTKLVPRRNSEKMSENREMMRRSPRFSDPESVESPARKELTGATKANSVRKSNDIIPSSAAGNLGKFRKLDSRKNPENSEFAEKSPASYEFMRRSPRFSGAGSVESPPCKKEIVGTTEENLAKESDDIDTSSSMAEKVGKIEEEKVLRRSPRGLGSISLVDDYGCDEMRELELESPKKKKKKEKKAAPERREEEGVCEKKSENCFFIGEPVLEEEARQRWGWRYELKNRRVKSRSFTANAEEEDEPILKVKCHYTQAQINGCIFNLGDCALIRGEGRQEHIGKIMEFFQTVEALDYFRVQWFYKAEDTVLKEEASFHDKKRIFYSTIMNDNLLDCIISKVNVVQITPQLNLESSTIPPSDFYYDMEYCLEYSTFRNLPGDYTTLNSPESVLSLNSTPLLEDISTCEPRNSELTMLDLYAGCGAMSTGLCVGARLAGVDLVTRWAIDCDSAACESLRLNHPETQVRNEEAEDFLELLKHWEKLCKKFASGNGETPSPCPEDSLDGAESSDAQSDDDIAADELEVSSLVDICYGDTGGSGKSGVKFKVRWKGYGLSEDTWEPIEGLSNCQDLIQEFVTKGFKNKILPFPGDIDVICGGPPCQGISGYNRFRSFDAPLADERNRQLVVFMDIVEYLKPKFVLMENVTDILRFDKASLGRYALSRLVHMNYQARVGIMAAGCYGLPQFRLRVFFWGALPIEELPQFPLPTHDVVVRYWPPPEFERNVVAYEEGQPSELEDAVFLRDAISDLPEVTNYESSDEMPYSRPPETEFQKYIRSTNYEMIGSASSTEAAVLYDHRPHQLFEDDYVRVRQIPHRKGANFRDLPGILVGDDNVVRRDPKEKPVLLPSGMPMVPEYVFTFEQGKSKRPFARLWWDETMPTVITYPNCHSQAVLHPEQDRVLTVREWARLQGFPDSYRFCGTVKKRYRQVGNAVAIPVAKALGYVLGMASQKLIGKEPLTTLPPKFAYSYRL